MSKDLTRVEIAVLEKIFEVSGKNAALAFSRFFKSKTSIKKINLDLVDLPAKSFNVEEAEGQFLSNFFTFSGEITGNITLAVPDKKIEAAISKDLRKMMGDIDEQKIEEMVKEVANIVVGAFFTSLSDYCKINILESTPVYKKSDLKKTIKEGVDIKGVKEDKAIVLEMRFRMKRGVESLLIVAMGCTDSKNLISYLKIDKWKEFHSGMVGKLINKV